VPAKFSLPLGSVLKSVKKLAAHAAVQLAPIAARTPSQRGARKFLISLFFMMSLYVCFVVELLWLLLMFLEPS
jgi:hypothetical protein